VITDPAETERAWWWLLTGNKTRRTRDAIFDKPHSACLKISHLLALEYADLNIARIRSPRRTRSCCWSTDALGIQRRSHMSLIAPFGHCAQSKDLTVTHTEVRWGRTVLLPRL